MEFLSRNVVQVENAKRCVKRWYLKDIVSIFFKCSLVNIGSDSIAHISAFVPCEIDDTKATQMCAIEPDPSKPHHAHLSTFVMKKVGLKCNIQVPSIVTKRP